MKIPALTASKKYPKGHPMLAILWLFQQGIHHMADKAASD